MFMTVLQTIFQKKGKLKANVNFKQQFCRLVAELVNFESGLNTSGTFLSITELQKLLKWKIN